MTQFGIHFGERVVTQGRRATAQTLPMQNGSVYSSKEVQDRHVHTCDKSRSEQTKSTREAERMDSVIRYTVLSIIDAAAWDKACGVKNFATWGERSHSKVFQEGHQWKVKTKAPSNYFRFSKFTFAGL